MSKKVIRFGILALVFLTFFSIVSAANSTNYSYTFYNVSGFDYGVANVSLKTSYGLGENISGNFSLFLNNAPNDLVISSSLGEEDLRSFLKDNGNPLSCETTNCSGIYGVSNSGETSKSLSSDTGLTELGFYFSGRGVSVNSFSWNVSSNFPEMNESPLTIQIGNGQNWTYQTFSTNYNNPRQYSDGCFNESLSSYDNLNIGTTNYCEKVNLNSSSSYFLGVSINGSGNSNFIMILQNSYGQQQGNSNCNFTKSSSSYSDTNGCVVSFTAPNAQGDYFICIKSNSSNSGYSLKGESSGQTCGYYNTPTINLTADYSLYVKLPMYASSSGNLNFSNISLNSDVVAVNDYLQSRYRGDCSSGCTVPVKIYRNNIPLSFNNMNIRYVSSTGETNLNKIYEVNKQIARVNFSGFLSLDSLGWKLKSYGNTTLTVYLKGAQNNKLFNQTVFVKDVPLVNNIYPSNPPAGVDTFLYADVRNKDGLSLYYWDFGDGTRANTTDPFVIHNYANITNYNLTLTFGNSNFSNAKTFVISTVSPKDYLNITINTKRAKLTKVSGDINSLPVSYKSFVNEKVKPDFYLSEINKIEVERAAAISDSDFLTIAQKLSNLIVPWAIITTEKNTGSMFYDYNSVDPLAVTKISPFNDTDLSAYKPVIFSWQMQNIESIVTKEKIQLLKENNQFDELLTHYSVQLKSNSEEESYFIIQEDTNNLKFSSSNVNVRNLGSKESGIILGPKESLSVDFYVEGSRDVFMYVSPKLSSLAIGNDVSVCNFNKFCEKDLGENYGNCRSDCKPILSTTLWIIIIIILALIVYTILQIWYKIRYEEYLFKDRAELFNLVMFINNSRMNGLSNKEIEKILLERKWTKEQVDYAMKKSEGKNPGMFEIIPVDKVVAYLEKKKAEKMKDQKMAPPINKYPMNPNFMGGNINK